VQEPVVVRPPPLELGSRRSSGGKKVTCLFFWATSPSATADGIGSLLSEPIHWLAMIIHETLAIPFRKHLDERRVRDDGGTLGSCLWRQSHSHCVCMYRICSGCMNHLKVFG
jgi:hypothetical protein